MDPKNIIIAAEETKKQIDFDRIIAEGNDLHNAIKGVESFVNGNIDSSKVTLENIDILNGLIASVLALSYNHELKLEQFRKQM